MTLDWNTGFSFHEGDSKVPIWQYKFSQLRGSSDDGKSKLKLHFQDLESRAIETKVNFCCCCGCSDDVDFSGVGVFHIAKFVVLHACISYSESSVRRSGIFVLSYSVKMAGSVFFRLRK